MNQATEPRCLVRCTTAELTKLALHGAGDYAALHEIYAELLFRKRRTAIRLREKIRQHLSQLHEVPFPWPTTVAAPGDGSLDAGNFQYVQGMLGYLGYKVGVSGGSWAQRRLLLDYVFLNTLPRIDSEVYTAKWGKSNGATRLKKLAKSIATFIRNAKRKKSKSYTVAIRNWEADLEYLKKTYYVGRYDFPWPKTVV